MIEREQRDQNFENYKKTAALLNEAISLLEQTKTGHSRFLLSNIRTTTCRLTKILNVYEKARRLENELEQKENEQ
jgi:hypothetical protein